MWRRSEEDCGIVIPYGMAFGRNMNCECLRTFVWLCDRISGSVVGIRLAAGRLHHESLAIGGDRNGHPTPTLQYSQDRLEITQRKSATGYAFRA